jgi:hypothetical protein
VRIGVVVVYTGSSLPAWFAAFADSCAASRQLADWLIFTDGAR